MRLLLSTFNIIIFAFIGGVIDAGATHGASAIQSAHEDPYLVTTVYAPVDSITSILIGAILGGVTGWVFNTFSSPTARKAETRFIQTFFTGLVLVGCVISLLDGNWAMALPSFSMSLSVFVSLVALQRIERRISLRRAAGTED